MNRTMTIPAPRDTVCFESRLKWTPLSRPFFARNKLMPGGVLGLSFGGGYGSPPPAIPALESALGSHPCGALSSVQVPSL
jgi:hypothetical protein